MSGPQDPLAKAIRSAAGDQYLKQTDIADFMGLSHTTVGEWFRGKRKPSQEQTIELERILQVESGALCVLAGYLPEGTNPKIERTEGAIIVRLEPSPVPPRSAHNPRSVTRLRAVRPTDNRPLTRQAA